jgi:hypothetical protein
MPNRQHKERGPADPLDADSDPQIERLPDRLDSDINPFGGAPRGKARGAMK